MTTKTQKRLQNVRLLCWIQTAAQFHDSRTIHIQATWSKRCDKHFFVSDRNDSRLPIFYVDVPTGRQYLSKKHGLAWDHVYEKYLNDFDWFYKGDDDTYVIVENLRQFLASKNASNPVYFGHHFKTLVKPSGYFSGGSGYVISQEALRRWGTRPDEVYDMEGGEFDDVLMGSAMQALEVQAGDSRDEKGLQRFYINSPASYILEAAPNWIEQYDKYPQKMVTIFRV